MILVCCCMKMIRNHSDDITHLKALNEELQERLIIETEER